MNKRKGMSILVFAAVSLVVFAVASVAMAKEPESTGAGWASVEKFGSIFRRDRPRFVRCDRGRSLSRALAWARPGDTLKIYGTCVESIVIRTDRITLKGINGAAIDGGSGASEAVVLVDGARGVRIESLNIVNGTDQGILLQRQAEAVLEGLNLSMHGTVGLSVDRSHVEIEDIVLDGNRVGGIDAYSGSTVLARGEISAINNGGDGLAVNGKSLFELRGATVTASMNGGNGVSIINDSRLMIFSFPEAQGSSITSDGNVFAGIALLGSELGVVGSQFFGSGANVISGTNNLTGFFISAGGILSPHATGRFVAAGNNAGMIVEDNASLLIVGGLDLSQNGTGLSAIGAGTLTVVSVPPNPSRIVENDDDVEFGFGTRATLQFVEVGRIACDGTELVRGTAGCPQPEPDVPGAGG